MKKIHIKENQEAVVNEDAKITDLNSFNTNIDNTENESEDEETEVMETLEALVDSVMEAASEVREFIQANSGTLSEEKEEYMKHIDGKMNYILSELF